MNIGKLDRRITIEQPDDRNRAADNSPIVTWGARATVWANVRYTNGSNSNEGQQRVQNNHVEFSIRYLGTVETSDRILFDGNYYLISSIDEIGRREGLKIKATWKDNYEG